MAPWLASEIRPQTRMHEAPIGPALSGSVGCHVAHSRSRSVNTRRCGAGDPEDLGGKLLPLAAGTPLIDRALYAAVMEAYVLGVSRGAPTFPPAGSCGAGAVGGRLGNESAEIARWQKARGWHG